MGLPVSSSSSSSTLAVVVLLLVLVSAPKAALAVSPFQSYMVDPPSSLDVVYAPSASAAHSSGGKQQAAGPSALQQQQRDIDAVRTRMLQQAAPANPQRLLPPYNVCVSSWAPMVRCTPDSAQEDFQGYQIELFRLAAKEVGWADDEYVFSCMDFSLIIADLSDPAGNCSLSATGVEVSPTYLAAGIKFSWPTYKSGLRVMISAHLQTGSTWAFAAIFRWEVWLMLGATSVLVGLLVAVLERLHRDAPAPGTHTAAPKGWQSWLWYSLAKVVHVIPHVGDPLSDASRVLILGYGFLVLVMVSMYTASAASKLTAAALVHPVHSAKDLQGADNPLKALTWTSYQAAIQARQKIWADGMTWEHEDDLHGMLAALRAGTYAALILDAPVLEYTAGTNEACDLFLVGDVFESFSLALAWPPAADDAVIYSFSQSIVKLQTYQGALDMLESVYISGAGTEKCFGSDSSGHGSGETIELRQVSGLWYILLMCVGVCFILTFAYNIRKDPRKMGRLRTWASFAGSTMRRERHPSVTTAATDNAVHPFRTSGDGAAKAPQSPLAGGQAGRLHPASKPAMLAVGPAGGGGGAAATPVSPAAAEQNPRRASTLAVFLGTSQSFAGESDDECTSPASPKKMPARLHLQH